MWGEIFTHLVYGAEVQCYDSKVYYFPDCGSKYIVGYDSSFKGYHGGFPIIGLEIKLSKDTTEIKVSDKEKQDLLEFFKNNPHYSVRESPRFYTILHGCELKETKGVNLDYSGSDESDY